jgi:hypothetical protein
MPLEAINQESAREKSILRRYICGGQDDL